jgi:hypothetical protein
MSNDWTVSKDRQHLLEQLQTQDEQIARMHRENRLLRKENKELFETLKQTCRQLHDTRKAILPGY